MDLLLLKLQDPSMESNKGAQILSLNEDQIGNLNTYNGHFYGVLLLLFHEHRHINPSLLPAPPSSPLPTSPSSSACPQPVPLFIFLLPPMTGARKLNQRVTWSVLLHHLYKLRRPEV